MASVILSNAGSHFLGPIGKIAGKWAGQAIDKMVNSAFTPSDPHAGPQLQNLYLSHASEGGYIPKLWGRSRLSSTIIWCAPFKENIESPSQHDRSKGKTSESKAASYRYTLSFAVAFCEGSQRTSLNRLFADGKELDLSRHLYRFYSGTNQQLPDHLIETIEGQGQVPAYRGICYIVFEDMDVTEFGNRVPQISAEILRLPDLPDPEDVTHNLRSVALLPGSGEFVYGTKPYGEYSETDSRSENVHNSFGIPNIVRALDQLQNETLTQAHSVSVIVTWFGTDLRANHCRILPKIESRQRHIVPQEWQVSHWNRKSAEEVSYLSSTDPTSAPSPVFGGTPDDSTLIQAIGHIKERGLHPVFYPFLMMDISQDNILPNPYGGVSQPAFPWRGRITCDPAPGNKHSPNETPAVIEQITQFFAAYRPMILHYADLCKKAGGVRAFLIGSELVGLTQLCADSDAHYYPAVHQLKQLAQEVKQILGQNCLISYAADWTEYHSHRPAAYPRRVIFNMDPLWADSSIDFIGIDHYLPLSDVQTNSATSEFFTKDCDLSSQNLTHNLYDRAYLQSHIEGGEYYDFYYETQEARLAQQRTPIQDSLYHKDWVFRQKDIRNWWQNEHYSRPEGLESDYPTEYAPQRKPIWFTEFGFPAVDKGTNQPNVFYDPKSSESALPYFSSGKQDDVLQRVALEALLAYWRDQTPHCLSNDAVVSSILPPQKMISLENMFAWAWDARPYPAFPHARFIWKDEENWEKGHWLSGRVQKIPLKWVVSELCAVVQVRDTDVSQLIGPDLLLTGYATNQLSSARGILNTLMQAFHFDAFESQGAMHFVHHSRTRFLSLPLSDCVILEEDPTGYHFSRLSETDLPRALRLSFIDAQKNYQVGTVEVQKHAQKSENIYKIDLAIVMDPATALEIADKLLHQIWEGRETARLRLPPSYLILNPSDGLSLKAEEKEGKPKRKLRILEIEKRTHLEVSLKAFESTHVESSTYSLPAPQPLLPEIPSRPIVEFLDFPILPGQETRAWTPLVAAFQTPWQKGIYIYKKEPKTSTTTLASNSSFSSPPSPPISAETKAEWNLCLHVTTPVHFGELISPLLFHAPHRWDKGPGIQVRFYDSPSLLSRSEYEVLGGANALAIKHPTQPSWEIIQFCTAELVAPRTYHLSHLLRGQLGTESAIAEHMPAGARILLLVPEQLTPLALEQNHLGLEKTFLYGPAAFDPLHPLYSQKKCTFQGMGFRPYSVVHLRLTPQINGDVLCTWQRRTRYNGDRWDPSEVPLNEARELYEINILELNSLNPRRTTYTSIPHFLYTKKDQLADFCHTSPEALIRICQISEIFGRGSEQDKHITLNL